MNSKEPNNLNEDGAIMIQKLFAYEILDLELAYYQEAFTMILTKLYGESMNAKEFFFNNIEIYQYHIGSAIDGMNALIGMIHQYNHVGEHIRQINSLKYKSYSTEKKYRDRVGKSTIDEAKTVAKNFKKDFYTQIEPKIHPNCFLHILKRIYENIVYITCIGKTDNEYVSYIIDWANNLFCLKNLEYHRNRQKIIYLINLFLRSKSSQIQKENFKFLLSHIDTKISYLMNIKEQLPVMVEFLASISEYNINNHINNLLLYLLKQITENIEDRQQVNHILDNFFLDLLDDKNEIKKFKQITIAIVSRSKDKQKKGNTVI